MKYADRAKQQTTTSGTGSLTLGATPNSFRSLVSQFASEERFLYVIQGPIEWEIGIGYVLSETLVRETPLEGSATVPVSFSSGVKDVFNADYASTVGGSHWSVFGDGIDGDVSIDEPVTLDDNKFYRNLTLGASANINTNGYKIYVSGVLDTTAATTGAIRAAGDLGGDGVTSTLGAGGAGAIPSYNGGGGNGSNGAAGIVGNGTVATAVTAPSIYLGGRGGSGGAGGDSGGAETGGAARERASVSAFVPRFALNDRLIATVASTALMVAGGSGGAGGSSGGGDVGISGGGGGGGAGGGIIDIAAAVLRVGSNVGVLLADGRNGGDAGESTGGGTSGGSGGGAGGGGGYIRAVFGHVLHVGTGISFASAAGGNGGQGGAGISDGDNGDGGYGGDGGRIEVHKLIAGTRSTTDGSAGAANTLTLGGTGGFCLVNV